MTQWLLLPEVRMIGAFLLSLYFGLISIPVIIDVARKKNLVDMPNHRTSHKGSIPNLGGMGIFGGFSIALLLFNRGYEAMSAAYVIAGAMVIFFVGLKDDLTEMTPMKKMAGQVIAALIIILFADIRITHLHGFLGFYEINYVSSLLITTFLFLVIINSYNLVDGIDGLAAGLAIVSTIFFVEWFLKIGQTGLVVMGLSLIGVLLAFLRYNLLDTRYKIFMGDTGSLLIGFFLSVMTVQFNELNLTVGNEHALQSVPALSFAIMMVPLFDTLRLFMVRFYRKCTPFAPDRAHMHHYLLKLGFSHLNATYFLMLENILFVLLAWQFQWLGVNRLFILLLSTGTVLTIVPIVIIYYRKRKRQIANHPEKFAKSE
ncbi:MraY family glycosyltransferase [Lentimicrobium sp.]